jgi:hypothetical protein
MSDAIHVLEGCISLALVWAFWHYGWRAFTLDVTRQRLFSIRDDLFGLALRAENGLSFDSRVYGALRASLNSKIRFAHRVSSYHIWIAMLFGTFTGLAIQQEMKNYKPEADIEIEALQDGELKQKLQAIRLRALQTTVMYLLINSPVFLLTTTVASIGILLSIIIKRGLLGSTKAFALAVKDEIKKRELEPSARAIQFQTDAMQGDNDVEVCFA